MVSPKGPEKKMTDSTSNEMTISRLYELMNKSQEDQTKKILEELKLSQNKFSQKIEGTEKAIKNLENKNLTIERKLRKNNIVIFGLTVEKETLLDDTISQLTGLLNISLSVADINNINLIGKQEQSQGILIQFVSNLKKQEIFKNVSKLKNKKISILNDLCLEDQETHRKLVKHLKEAKAKKLSARIIGHRLEINKTLYTIEDLEQLENYSKEESDEDKESEERTVEGTGIQTTATEEPKTTRKRRKRAKKDSPNSK